MCFRPTSASKKIKCAKCGKEITLMGELYKKNALIVEQN